MLAEPTEIRPPKCEECGEELTEVSERHISKHYNWVRGTYFESDTCYDASDLHCTKCGKELTPEQRNFFTDHL